MDGRKIIKYALILAGVALIIGYSYFTLNDFVRGPRIVISSPESGFSTTTPAITIAGRAIHVNNLSINGDPTPFDLEGNFSSRLILAPGYNIMTLEALDRYGRTEKEIVEMTLLGTARTGGTIDTGAEATTQATSTVPEFQMLNF
ncbi:MAG: hypothetical protein AAB497_02870 [Patescibacteria group bacterium]